MLEIYQTTAKDVKEELNKRIAPYICGEYEIKYNKNGKPCLENNPVYFSISHCKDTAVIALCDKPVGIDLELIENRNFKSVLSRFTEREKADISGSLEKFLINWVAKEAYIKAIGGSISRHLKRLEYVGGKLYFEGVEKQVQFKDICGAICAVCIEEIDNIQGVLYESLRNSNG